MDYENGHVMTLANSIIGVGIIAMPYCFKECGIILSVAMLLLSSVISRLSSYFLLKSAINSRRKTFELLAHVLFGSPGKLIVEIALIGFLLGTNICFFVVIGDLAPEIVSQIIGVKNNNTLRTFILTLLGLFCVLPLGLLRNIESVSGVSKATIGFYCCLVLNVIFQALPRLFTSNWFFEINWWRPAGVLQCLPIFSMALFCQPQLFEIYQVLPNISLESMNSLIRISVLICTAVYTSVGTFGYIAFFKQPLDGNILSSFFPSITTDILKMGFVVSVIFSFPLTIFPCRASLHSLIYRGSYSVHEGSANNYIPAGRFKALTIAIVLGSLITGILIPNIELVLGLVGSTIGVGICVLFPSACFICVFTKNTNERILAQIVLCIGIIIMVLGTYANMNALEKTQNQFAATEVNIILPGKMLVKNEKVAAQIVSPEKLKIHPIPPASALKKHEIIVEKKDTQVRHEPPEPIEAEPESINVINKVIDNPKVKLNNVSPSDDLVNANAKLNEKSIVKPLKEEVAEVRHEPPQPEEPLAKKMEPLKIEEKPKEVVEVQNKPPLVEELIPNQDKAEHPNEGDKVKESHEPSQPKEPLETRNKILIENKKKFENKIAKDVDQLPAPNAINLNDSEVIKPDETIIDIEALKKEDTEIKSENIQTDANVLLDTLIQHNKLHEKFAKRQERLEERLIKVIEKQQEKVKKSPPDKVQEEKVRAVKEIENIAKQAIKELVQEEPNNIKNDSSKLKNVQFKKQNISNDVLKPLVKKDAPISGNSLKHKISEKPIVNASPLSYQLGLNLQNRTANLEIPLPLLRSLNFTQQIKKDTNVESNKIKKIVEDKKTIDDNDKDNIKDKNEEPKKVKEENEHEDILRRRKRNVDENIENQKCDNAEKKFGTTY